MDTTSLENERVVKYFFVNAFIYLEKYVIIVLILMDTQYIWGGLNGMEEFLETFSLEWKLPSK